MCGIAGIFRRDGAPAEGPVAERMIATLHHRGPDGHGVFARGPVALAHARLAIRDMTELGAQPLRDPGGAGVLVYNGEIYGEGALRSELEAEGARIEGTGDARVLLAALALHGVAWTLRRIDGMFAFAWWDAREHRLHLARDRFGIKPLHVAVGADAVYFASEIRALRTIAGVACRPNLLELARRVQLWPIDERHPPFEGVRNVLPGEWWRIDAQGIEQTTWCDPALEVDTGRIRAAARAGPETWEQWVRDAVEVSVRDHLASDVPVAVFTSGGVDSNLVAAIAREHRPDLVAYTVDVCHPESEAGAAAQIARHINIPLRVVKVDRTTFLARFADAVLAHEHPLPHPCLIPTLLLAERARADGIRVALTGEGADELFGGYDYLQRTREQWRRAYAPWARWHRRGRAAQRDLAAVPFRYQSIRREPDVHLRMTAALAPAEETAARAILGRLAAIEPPPDRAFLAHSLDALRRHLPWLLLRHDRMCMAHSLEARVPFLCDRVADVALHLPVAAKLRGNVGKWVLKRLAARRLPAAQVYAPKKGFPVPHAHHAGVSAMLRGGVAAELLNWTSAATQDLLPRIEASPGLRVQMLGLEVWARIFIAGESPGQITERLLSIRE